MPLNVIIYKVLRRCVNAFDITHNSIVLWAGLTIYWLYLLRKSKTPPR